MNNKFKLFFSIIFLLQLTSCVFIGKNNDLEEDSFFEPEYNSDYITVKVTNNSTDDIINWYLIDTKTNDKYGKKRGCIVEQQESNSLQFKGYTNYKLIIEFDYENDFETEIFYLNKNREFIITGTRRFPKYEIQYITNSNKSILTNKLQQEQSELLN